MDRPRLYHHTYRSFADLYAIGRLVRRIVGRNFGAGGWSFARHDIWCQRRIADTIHFDNPAWQSDIDLWLDAQGEVRAALIFPDRRRPANAGLCVPLVEIDYPALYDSVLDLAAERCAERGLPPERLAFECSEGNLPLVQLLTARGYTRSKDYMNLRLRRLSATPDPVCLPTGYRLETIDTSEQRQAFFEAVHTVFGFMDCHPAYRSMEQGPSYRHELGLVVRDPEGRVAAFGTTWWDPTTNLAEFEPMGTLPEQQQRGLGLAVMAESCNRLRRLGCFTATVQSWSESVGANRLYEKAGFAAQSRHYEWTRPQS